MAEKTSTTAKVAATAKKGIIRSVTSMVHNLIKEVWDEVFQLFILGSILGLNKGGSMAEKEDGKPPTEKKLGGGTRLFHAFSHEDEIKWNKLFSTVRELLSGVEEKFMAFLRSAVDREGYDEDTLRIRLIGSFSKKELSDPAIQTVQAIVGIENEVKREQDEAEASWRSRVLQRQIEFAKGRKLLVHKSVKNFLLAMNRNKLATLMWIVVIILVTLRGCAWLFA